MSEQNRIVKHPVDIQRIRKLIVGVENPHSLGVRSFMSKNRSTVNVYYLIASVSKEFESSYLHGPGLMSFCEVKMSAQAAVTRRLDWTWKIHFQTAHSHGGWAGAGCRREASVPRHSGLSRALLRILWLLPQQVPQESKIKVIKCFMP